MKMLLDVSNDGQLLSFVPWGQKCRIRRVLNFDTLYRVTFELADYTIQLLLFCVYINSMIYIVISFLGHNFDCWENVFLNYYLTPYSNDKKNMFLTWIFFCKV